MGRKQSVQQIIQRKINRLKKQKQQTEMQWLTENIEIRIEELQWVQNIIKEKEAKTK